MRTELFEAEHMTAPDHVADPIISSLRLGGRPHMTHIPSPHATDFVNHVSNYVNLAHCHRNPERHAVAAMPAFAVRARQGPYPAVKPATGTTNHRRSGEMLFASLL